MRTVYILEALTPESCSCVRAVVVFADDAAAWCYELRPDTMYGWQRCRRHRAGADDDPSFGDIARGRLAALRDGLLDSAEERFWEGAERAQARREAVERWVAQKRMMLAAAVTEGAVRVIIDRYF